MLESNCICYNDWVGTQQPEDMLERIASCCGTRCGNTEYRIYFENSPDCAITFYVYNLVFIHVNLWTGCKQTMTFLSLYSHHSTCLYWTTPNAIGDLFLPSAYSKNTEVPFSTTSYQQHRECAHSVEFLNFCHVVTLVGVYSLAVLGEGVICTRHVFGRNRPPIAYITVQPPLNMLVLNDP